MKAAVHGEGERRLWEDLVWLRSLRRAASPGVGGATNWAGSQEVGEEPSSGIGKAGAVEGKRRSEVGGVMVRDRKGRTGKKALEDGGRD